MLAGFNSDDVKTTLRSQHCFKMNLPLLQVPQKSHLIPLSLCYSEYRVNKGSMWPTGQTSNNSVINIRCWRCPLPSGPSLAFLHPNGRLETHFVLLLTKIIEYTVFQLSLFHWFVFTETSTQYLNNLGGLMERSDSQPIQFMLSRINSFQLMTKFLLNIQTSTWCCTLVKIKSWSAFQLCCVRI